MNPKLELCEECGRAGYNHRRIGLLQDGQLTNEMTLCRPCATTITPRIQTNFITANAQKR